MTMTIPASRITWGQPPRMSSRAKLRNSDAGKTLSSTARLDSRAAVPTKVHLEHLQASTPVG
jgi:hypothetical protein